MALSVVSSTTQWIGYLLIQEGRALFEVENQVRNLQDDLEFIQQYLQDAEAKEEVREVRTLIRQIRKLAYDAEDVIDTYIFKVQSKVAHGNVSWPMKFVRFLWKSPHIHDVGMQIKVIQSRLKDVTEKFSSYGLRRINELGEGFRLSHVGKLCTQSYPYDDDDGQYVVGMEKSITKLVEVLMGEGEDPVSVLSIVGMGGSGKTTLARKLYNHPYTKECFDCKAWVYISQNWSTQHVLSQILRKVDVSKETLKMNADIEELVENLRHLLEKKSYLIVLDDVWSRKALEDILPALPRGNTKRESKIVITTRNRESIQSPIFPHNHYIYEPRPLSDEEGWELFQKIAFNQSSNYNRESFETLANKMLKKCNGLPIAIVALSGILRARSSISEWQQVNEAVLSRVMGGMGALRYGRVGDLLALSYQDLPYYLKPCFLYLGVFPEDCQIPVGMLTRMWIAEGLVTSHGRMSPEDVAKQYLEDLSNRFMVQVARVNFNGEIKAVRLHDLLRDFCLSKAKEQNFLEVHSPLNDPAPFDVVPLAIESRRAALHSSVSFPTQVSHLRSLVMLMRSSVSNSAYEYKETLCLKVVHNNFKLLRLLNLWGIKTADGTLPTQIGSLIHLRYLGVRASNIIELPMSIGNLRNLLTLDYRNIDSNNQVSIKIPDVLSKLVLLRHLFLPIECTWSAEHLQLSALKNLRILWGVKQDGGGDWLSKEVSKFSTTIQKLKIVVSTEKDLVATFCCPSLPGLRKFHCELRNNVALQQVEPISHHQNLHKLRIFGEVQIKLSLILPSNLVILELKDSMLKDEDPMKAIGELPHLKLLRLLNSYLGTIFDCKMGSFPQLEELYLENFRNLDTWRIDKGSMLRLKKLEILGCRKLRHFPGGLPFMATLQQMEFSEVPKEFAQKTREYGWSHEKFRLPQNYETIINKCDFLIGTSSGGKLYEHLTAGVFLNGQKQKFWVTKQNDRYYNCFMLYAMDSHTWSHSNDIKVWVQTVMAESVGKVETIFNGSQVRGMFDTSNLSLQAKYEVSYVIKLPPESAWGRRMSTAGSSLFLSDETISLNHKLDSKPRDEWIRLSSGEFTITQKNIGIISFYLDNIEFGVIVKGAIIEPVFQPRINQELDESLGIEQPFTTSSWRSPVQSPIITETFPTSKYGQTGFGSGSRFRDRISGTAHPLLPPKKNKKKKCKEKKLGICHRAALDQFSV